MWVRDTYQYNQHPILGYKVTEEYSLFLVWISSLSSPCHVNVLLFFASQSMCQSLKNGTWTTPTRVYRPSIKGEVEISSPAMLRRLFIKAGGNKPLRSRGGRDRAQPNLPRVISSIRTTQRSSDRKWGGEGGALLCPVASLLNLWVHLSLRGGWLPVLSVHLTSWQVTKAA